VDQTLYSDVDVGSEEKKKQGLRPAIDELVSGGQWRVVFTTPLSSGLMVLERLS